MSVPVPVWTPISLEQAKRHLYIDELDTSRDVDVQDKLDEAFAAVVNYMKLQPEQWIVNPAQAFAIRSATLQMLTVLFENRGDDGGEASKFERGYLPWSVTALLYPLRDPALA